MRVCGGGIYFDGEASRARLTVNFNDDWGPGTTTTPKLQSERVYPVVLVSRTVFESRSVARERLWVCRCVRCMSW